MLILHADQDEMGVSDIPLPNGIGRLHGSSFSTTCVNAFTVMKQKGERRFIRRDGAVRTEGTSAGW